MNIFVVVWFVTGIGCVCAYLLVSLVVDARKARTRKAAVLRPVLAPDRDVLEDEADEAKDEFYTSLEYSLSSWLERSAKTEAEDAKDE